MRNILLAEPMVQEYAELFRGMDEVGIDDLLRSFRFENCARREALAPVLSEHAVPGGVRS